MAKSFKEMLGKVPSALRDKALAEALRDQQMINTAKAVKRIREAAHLGQQQLATALGVSQPAIAKMERQTDMKLSTLQAIAKAAGGKIKIQVKLPKKSFTIE